MAAPPKVHNPLSGKANWSFPIAEFLPTPAEKYELAAFRVPGSDLFN
jgi:hypothetical protein